MTAAGLRVPRSAIAHSHRRRPRGGGTSSGCRSSCARRSRSAAPAAGSSAPRPSIERIVGGGLAASPIGQVLLEESVLGWGEFELEVMRDRADNVVIVCSIENLDPMGVHTGDSVCVAPQQTLTDKQYQALRDQAITVIRAVGVETGGSNVQFAVNPDTDEIVVIEMNPRVSRSSALASKATGFPIAKIAARLAVGYTLQEIPNDITRATPASFEPAIDYCVVKWPRFAFEKFPGAEAGLTTHMKSVGEAMAIGRTFKQAFAKALRSRELDTRAVSPADDEALLDAGGAARGRALRSPPGGAAPRHVDRAELHRRTSIDRWFLLELAELVADPEAAFAGERTYKSVDTCAAEFAAETPYYYSAWERPGTRPAHPPRGDRRRPGRARRSVVILGSGPNRIGQGIEFDYCCVHAAQTVRELGRDAVMVNCNPETVSTDYDTSDRLYFEPLTLEDVLGVCELEQPEGVVVQFGGQTPLKLAAGLDAAGVRILGTSIDAIDLAEDRSRFGALLDALGYTAPPYATASSAAEEALDRAPEVGFPLLVRPELRARRPGDGDRLQRRRACRITWSVSGRRPAPPSISTASWRTRSRSTSTRCATARSVWIAGIMQHVEEAGIHSGDSACVLPPHTLGDDMLERIREQTTGIARALGVVGLLNVQFAIHGDDGLHVIEANPRASRTVPFVSKAIGPAPGQAGLPDDARRADRRPRSARGRATATCASRRSVLPFRPLRRRRRTARPGDALHRRGHGHRPRLPDRVRQGPGGRRGPAAQRGHGVHHRRRRGQAGGDRHRQPRCTTSASRSSPPAAPRRRCGGWASRRAGSTRSARARPTSSTGSSAARSTS